MGNKIARPLIVTTSEPEAFPEVLPVPDSPVKTPEKVPVPVAPDKKVSDSYFATVLLVAVLAFACYNVGHES